MLAFSTTCEEIAATTKKSEKVRLAADYFRAFEVDQAAQAAVFLSGRAFPSWEERTLQVESGFALRFPRILRLRTDKPLEEIDTLETVREIYDRQKMPQKRAL
jgi:ATP-dependent DNA ligase